MSGTAEVVNATHRRGARGRPRRGAADALGPRARRHRIRRARPCRTPTAVSTALPGTAPAADGTYAVDTAAVEGARYRVTTPHGDSPAIAPNVTARVAVHLAVRHHGRKLLVAAHTMPAAPGHGRDARSSTTAGTYRWRGRRAR